MWQPKNDPKELQNAPKEALAKVKVIISHNYTVEVFKQLLYHIPKCVFTLYQYLEYTLKNQYQIFIFYLPDSNVSSSMVSHGDTKKTKSVILLLSILSLYFNRWIPWPYASAYTLTSKNLSWIKTKSVVSLWHIELLNEICGIK